MAITIREITKNRKRLILEISLYDFRNHDFYEIWDKIREKYSENEYKLDFIDAQIYRVVVEFSVNSFIKQ
jgi:hypothetical protein